MAAISALPAGCLLMAAGNASRFGENKLAACFDGQSLFSLALAAIPAEMFARVTVVSQYPALLEEASLAGFDTILNDRPEDGISRTIRLGTQAMADCAGILYGRRPTAAAGRDGAARRGRVAGEPGLHRRCGAQRKARQPVPVPGAVLPGAVRIGG
ncbi:MAG: NTP transferase domain-containing protein [Oscillospiraceae bacterium]